MKNLIVSGFILAGCMASTAFADEGVFLQFDTSQLPAAMVGNTTVQYGGRYYVGKNGFYVQFNWSLINQEVQLNTINVPVETLPGQLEFFLPGNSNFIIWNNPNTAIEIDAAPPQNPICAQTLASQPLNPGVNTIVFSVEPLRPLPGGTLPMPGYWVDCKVINQ